MAIVVLGRRGPGVARFAPRFAHDPSARVAARATPGPLRPRTLLHLLSALLVLASAPSVWAQTVGIAGASVAELNKAFEAGTLTSEALVQMYLDRIAAYDQQGPALNAMLFVNPRALEQARALDAERKAR